MPNRKIIIQKLVVGDIFHAESSSMPSLICLTTNITKTTIESRVVTTQISLRFDRVTGVAEWGDEPVVCTIDSVAPLPVGIHNVFLGIDRKFRLGSDFAELDSFQLNDDEKSALLYVADFYPLNLLAI
ncbi:MAG: hypothetical protein GY820_37090 [Gammaproteobacteria bacterium]|nr:hypothetical protein [Gammaproteobacteria bacterium]